MNSRYPQTTGRLRRGAVLMAALLTAAAISAAPAWAAASRTAVPADASRVSPAVHLAGEPDLGPNVYVFTPSMPQSQIQATVNSIANQQVPNQFGTQRYALLFEPGTYGSAADPLSFQVGYYTEVAGLGASPGDVTINGTIDVYNQCFPTTDGSSNCIALDNFWRSLSNLTINVTGQTGCQAGTDFWAVSQAAPMRRVNVTGGNLSLMDYCSAARSTPAAGSSPTRPSPAAPSSTARSSSSWCATATWTAGATASGTRCSPGTSVHRRPRSRPPPRPARTPPWPPAR